MTAIRRDLPHLSYLAETYLGATSYPDRRKLNAIFTLFFYVSVTLVIMFVP